MHRDSVRAGLSGVQTPVEQEVFFSTDRLWDPSILLNNGNDLFLLGVKRPGRNHELSSSSWVEVKNEWSYTSVLFCFLDLLQLLLLPPPQPPPLLLLLPPPPDWNLSHFHTSVPFLGNIF